MSQLLCVIDNFHYIKFIFLASLIVQWDRVRLIPFLISLVPFIIVVTVMLGVSLYKN